MKRELRKLMVISLVFLFAFVFTTGSGAVIKEGKTAKKSQPQTFVPSGDDTFETPDNAETKDDFSESPIPAGFFGPGSLPFRGTITLKGKPLPEYGDDNIDTVITRESGGYVPFTTSVRIKALSMENSAPITVSYEDGHTENWDVTVALSTSVASTGSMTIKADGTFDSTLDVYPLFTFTKSVGLNRANAESKKVLDTGSPMVQMYLQSIRRDDIARVLCPVLEPVDDHPVETIEDGETINEKSTVPKVVKQQQRLCTPPIKLSAPNSPWRNCGGKFCIPVPITEAALLAKHFAKFKLPRRGIR